MKTGDLQCPPIETMPSLYSVQKCLNNIFLELLQRLKPKLLSIYISVDNHNTYCNTKSSKTKQSGVLSAYPENSFSMVSVDYPDFLHCYARVSCGKQESSWCGTSVHVVQPQLHVQNLMDSTQPSTTYKEMRWTFMQFMVHVFSIFHAFANYKFHIIL